MNPNATNPPEKLSRAETFAQIEAMFDTMVHQQSRKVMNLARSLVPHVTGEDLLNPHDYPVLAQSPEFNYEDGYLNALQAAQIAIRREFKQS